MNSSFFFRQWVNSNLRRFEQFLSDLRASFSVLSSLNNSQVIFNAEDAEIFAEGQRTRFILKTDPLPFFRIDEIVEVLDGFEAVGAKA